ncbi:MAG TPA: HAD-IB family hydrolase [Steroidobacteraceae bacterium]|nr:HAD-IB family hydrolase [Steroidobacteraceae bacterium]
MRPDANAAPPRRLAVFDLDGTVTRRDTFMPYLRGWLRRHPRRRGWLRALTSVLRFTFAGRDRGRLKSGLLKAFLSGAGREEIEAWSGQFVAQLDDAELFRGALEAIARHREAGDRLVLLSASVDLYVPRIAQRLGFDEAICTGVAWRDGRLDGALTTANRRGEEKRRCIEELRSRYPGCRIAAYANSASDIVHLAAVEEPLLVNGSRRSRRRAASRGIPAADW